MESTAFKVTRWILIILAVFLMVALVVFIISKPNSSKNSSQEKPTSIMDYSTTGTFIFSQVGSVSAQETHQSIVISVSNTSRNLSIYRGYNTAPITTKSYTNNQTAFNAFIQAIGGAGFMNSRSSSSGSFEGSCTLGVRFTYQLSNNTSTMPVNTWSNSCSSKQGTFGGVVNNNQQLFKAQIPDYNTLTSGVVL